MFKKKDKVEIINKNHVAYGLIGEIVKVTKHRHKPITLFLVEIGDSGYYCTTDEMKKIK